MKKLVLSLVVISISFNLLDAQTCLEDGITFTTQSQIDSFQINYPDCIKILGSVTIRFDITNLIALSSIQVIGGDLEIGYTDNLHNLNGLESLDSIGGDFWMSSFHIDWYYPNDSLSNIEGLSGLSYVGGNLNIEHVPLLENLDGLENLTSIGGHLLIRNNPLLENLDVLENLTSIGGGLAIAGLPVLENIEGLSNLTSISGNIAITNLGSLTSLQGIQNIDPEGINEIQIRYNYNLSYCEVASVCSHLLNGGFILFHDNAVGCNTEEEILLACAWLDVDEVAPQKPFSIYPNPTSKDLYITSDQTPSRYKIYNQLGQVLLEGNEVSSPVNVSNLEAGNYILELSFKDEVYREKIIVY